MEEQLIKRIGEAGGQYNRLVLLVGPPGSGKTVAFRGVAEHTGGRLLNLNLELSRLLLDLTARQRALRLSQLLEEALGGDDQLVLLGNIEILFDPALKHDPLGLLQRASRNRTIVAAWSGAMDGGYLTYAEPGHPEFRRYRSRGLLVVRPETTR